MKTRDANPRQAGQPKRKRSAVFSGNALLVTILLHLFFGLIATYLIVEHFQKKKPTFTSQAPQDTPEEIEHKIQVQKRNSAQSAPQDLKRIVTTSVSDIVLPDPPEVPPPDDAQPTMMSGAGGDGMFGDGHGNGTGGPGTGGGFNIDLPYGAPGKGGLVGTLYDLKQTPDRDPTDIAENAIEQTGGFDRNWATSPASLRGIEVLRDFIRTWEPDVLDRYYKSPQTLSAPQICIPVTASENAPKAFKVEGIVHPRRWIVVYHAKIIPPEAGSYRFVGFGDDFMAVRVGERNVLDASWSGTGEELDPQANSGDDLGIGWESQKLKVGKWVQMDAGEAVEMKVLIGEGPGGQSGFLLLVQKLVDGQPGPLCLFQLQDTPVPPISVTGFSGKKMLFSVPQESDDPSEVPTP